MKNIYHEIKFERAKQDERWGPEHDDKHTSGDWAALIEQRTDLGFKYGDYRRSLVEIAAIAVAAIEAHDRAQDKANGRVL